MVEAETLTKGQMLRVDLEQVRDRLPESLLKHLASNPFGKLIGFKMVDGNAFGLVLELSNGDQNWFFEEELSDAGLDDEMSSKNQKQQ